MIPIFIYCHVTFLLDNLLCYVAIVLYYVLCSIITLFIPLSNYKCFFLAKLTAIFVFNIYLNSPVSMFGKLCFDLVSKFEMVNEQNYTTDVEQFKGHDKRFILHCVHVRFRSG